MEVKTVGILAQSVAPSAGSVIRCNIKGQVMYSVVVYLYSEFQWRSNLRVAYASVRNRIWMYTLAHCAHAKREDVSRTSSKIGVHAIPYGSVRNTEIRTQLKFAVSYK